MTVDLSKWDNAMGSVRDSGVRASHVRREKTCRDCGEIYLLSHNQYNRSERCPDCQKIYKAEYDRNKNRSKPSRNRWEGGQGLGRDKKYKIKFDPKKDTDEAWGPDTHLGYNEITTLVGQHSICPGTVFTSETHILICYKGRVVRKKIEEEHEPAY